MRERWPNATNRFVLLALLTFWASLASPAAAIEASEVQGLDDFKKFLTSRAFRGQWSWGDKRGPVELRFKKVAGTLIGSLSSSDNSGVSGPAKDVVVSAEVSGQTKRVSFTSRGPWNLDLQSDGSLVDIQQYPGGYAIMIALKPIP